MRLLLTDKWKHSLTFNVEVGETVTVKVDDDIEGKTPCIKGIDKYTGKRREALKGEEIIFDCSSAKVSIKYLYRIISLNTILDNSDCNSITKRDIELTWNTVVIGDGHLFDVDICCENIMLQGKSLVTSSKIDADFMFVGSEFAGMFIPWIDDFILFINGEPFRIRDKNGYVLLIVVNNGNKMIKSLGKREIRLSSDGTTGCVVSKCDITSNIMGELISELGNESLIGEVIEEHDTVYLKTGAMWIDTCSNCVEIRDIG